MRGKTLDDGIDGKAEPDAVGLDDEIRATIGGLALPQQRLNTFAQSLFVENCPLVRQQQRTIRFLPQACEQIVQR